MNACKNVIILQGCTKAHFSCTQKFRGTRVHNWTLQPHFFHKRIIIGMKLLLKRKSVGIKKMALRDFGYCVGTLLNEPQKFWPKNENTYSRYIIPIRSLSFWKSSFTLFRCELDVGTEFLLRHFPLFFGIYSFGFKTEMFLLPGVSSFCEVGRGYRTTHRNLKRSGRRAGSPRCASGMCSGGVCIRREVTPRGRCLVCL